MCIFACQKALRRVLIEPGIANIEQHQPGQDRPNGKRLGKVERPVKQTQLVHSVRCRLKRFPDFRSRCGNFHQQENEHQHRTTEVEHDLHKVAPDNGIQAAEQCEHNTENDKDRRRDDDMLRLDIKEDDHRNRNSGKIQTRTARQDTADEIHPRRRASCRRVETGFQQFIYRGRTDCVESRYQETCDDKGSDDRGEVACEIAVIAAIAVIGGAEKCCRRLHRRQNGHRNQPDRRMMPGEEIVIRRFGPPCRLIARKSEQCDIGKQYAPVINGEC